MEQVNIDQLRQLQQLQDAHEQSLPEKVIVVDENAGQAGATDFRTVCRRLLTPKISEMRITNRINTKKDSTTYYVLFITRTQIRLQLSTSFSTDIWRYDYETDTIFVNETPQPSEFESEFVEKIRQIGDDLLANRASLSEKS